MICAGPRVTCGLHLHKQDGHRAGGETEAQSRPMPWWSWWVASFFLRTSWALLKVVLVGVSLPVPWVWGEPSRWAMGGHHFGCHPYRGTQLVRCRCLLPCPCKVSVQCLAQPAAGPWFRTPDGEVVGGGDPHLWVSSCW